MGSFRFSKVYRSDCKRSCAAPERARCGDGLYRRAVSARPGRPPRLLPAVSCSRFLAAIGSLLAAQVDDKTFLVVSVDPTADSPPACFEATFGADPSCEEQLPRKRANNLCKKASEGLQRG